MPLITTRRFRVRQYECDPFGYLKKANFLRYMQESAFDASAAAGYPMQKYAEMHRLWVIRTSEIEYLQPAKYDDCIEVKTWIADFRRATSRRMYEITRCDTAELLARGFSDWVYIDPRDGTVCSVPREMQEAFFPEGVPTSFPSRQTFPAAPPPPEGVYKVRRPVEWHDLDLAGHVNNAMYLNYAADCAMQLARELGWPLQRMLETGAVNWVRRHQLQHLQSALLGDELEIATWLAHVENSQAVRYTTIRRVDDQGEAGEVLARVHAHEQWMDVRTGQPRPAPEEVLADFSANIAG